MTGIPVELYQNDGSVGAALGAGIGAKIYSTPADAFNNMHPIQLIEPNGDDVEPIYQEWKGLLERQLIATI
jgi:xylulokinase